jgi:hypothetical protein
MKKLTLKTDTTQGEKLTANDVNVKAGNNSLHGKHLKWVGITHYCL